MTDSSTATEDRLRHILGIVDGHVKFAETKNAALFAANVGEVIGVLQVRTGQTQLQPYVGAYLLFVALAAIISGSLTLLSFLPVTQIPWFERYGKRRESDSLLFFGDIHQYDGLSYWSALQKASGQAERAPTGLERMYADQIIANAKIAARKFGYFKFAIWLTLFGVLTPLLAVPVLLVVTKHQNWSD